ncbi:MAG: helix-turn-helix domain-containing protein [Bacteroidales bacterium]|nr:helix-turn-helix domain-containing protein [Bacteroidales bacterium]HQP03732.1 helix-turn-helix domain-containing protein [Bacteroidales bacterium]
MNVITFETEAYAQIWDAIKNIEKKINDLHKSAFTPVSERWMDNQEVAVLMKISKRTLQTLRDEKKLPYTRIGKKFYYKAVDVEKFLTSNYNKVINF